MVNTNEAAEVRSGGIGTTLLTAAAAFAGSIVGNGLRLFTRELARDRERGRTTVDLTISGVVSTAIAAAALAHASRRRRPLIGFLVGAGLSAATGDMPDRAIIELLRSEPEGFVPMEREEEPYAV